MRTKSHRLLTAAGIALTVSVGAPSLWAQQPATAPTTTRFLVSVVRLKPEMMTEWLNLQRTEVIPAQKKAGVTSRTTLTNAVGNSFEYTTLTPFPTFAAMDEPAPLVKALGAEGAAKLNEKLRKCILTQHTFMTNRVEDLAIPAADALVWRTTIRKALPGKMQDYIAFHRAEVLPVLKQAKAAGKIAGSTFATRGVGAQAGEFTTTTYYAKFADLEGGDPLLLQLGREAANAINAKGATLATTVQTVIRRRVADLSF